MRIVYVVSYTKLDSNLTKISSEGYNSLKDAQKFIESRANKYTKIGEYVYADQESTMQISVVNIKGAQNEK